MSGLSTFPIPTIEDPRGNLSFLQKGGLPFVPSGVTINVSELHEGALIAISGYCRVTDGSQTIEALDSRTGILLSSSTVLEGQSKDFIQLNLFPYSERVNKTYEFDKWGEIAVDYQKIKAPFDIRRVYFLADVPDGAERGGHSHFRQQVLIMALRGRFRLLLDDGVKTFETYLSEPGRAIFVNAQVWRSMDSFEDGSIALILSSTEYDPSDYVYDYELFKRYTQRKRK